MTARSRDALQIFDSTSNQGLAALGPLPLDSAWLDFIIHMLNVHSKNHGPEDFRYIISWKFTETK